MNFQSLINGPVGVSTALFLGRAIPPRLGYPLAGWIASRIAHRRNTAMVQAVRQNQWVVAGENLNSEQLDRAVEATFQHTSHCLYDLYHNLHNPEAAAKLIRGSSRVEAIIRSTQERREGMIIVGLHMSNFDFVMQSAAMWGLQALAITLPVLGAGYQIQMELRKKAGLDIRPASVAVMKEAVHHLRAGGTVLTGIDRPVSDTKYRPVFFGRPAALPVFHIQLALLAKAPVYVAASIMQPDGIYELFISDPIHMEPRSDRQEELVFNAEKVLEVASDIICRAPHQWAMFYPVWPEVIIP